MLKSHGLHLGGCLLMLLASVAHGQSSDLSMLKPELEDLLKRTQIPGASVAVVDQGRVVWTVGLGVVDAKTQRPVTPQTMFQAASISKPVAALAALRLVDQKRMSLDQPIARHLKTPRPSWAKTVNLRQLLSHSAGLSVHGFAGYKPGARLPTSAQILFGRRPANSRAVRQIRKPGAFRFSGGGYCVIEQAIVAAAGKRFPGAMNDLVLQPLKMNASTYQQPLPQDKQSRAATGHDDSGQPLKVKWHVYPEMAAAGLWTTSSDLGRFIIAIQDAYDGRDGGQIGQATAREMLRPQSPNGPGLGLFVFRGEGGGGFSHSGANNGFRAKISATSKRGFGLVVMTNSDVGEKLYEPIEKIIRAKLRR